MNDKEFEIVFREHFTPLSNLAYTVVRNTDIAKDVVQQVFLKFWQIRDEVSIQSSVKSYLYRAVVNTSLNHIKKEKRFTSIEIQHIDTVYGQPETPSEVLAENTVEDKVHNAIKELPPMCREVFQMSRFSDLTNKEIAEELNITVKTVEKHITKAMKMLREKLQPLMGMEIIILLFFIVLIYFSCFEVGFFIIALSL
jgi:RNA polymerase sigma-70 factor, ECF subfamily